MRLMSIASGSSGNCIYAGSDRTHILIDAGISGKKIEEGLKKAEISPRDISAICVTHEHIDHIQGLGVMARRYEIPLYMTLGTRDAVMASGKVGEIPEDLFVPVQAGKDFCIRDLAISPIAISHDAADPVAYLMGDGKMRMGVVTDLGCYDEAIAQKLQGLDVLLLEANHDIRMLETGAYPYYLKERILGQKGHLSNEAAGQLLNRVLHDDIRQILLGHLSHENNLPELAYETVRMEITMGDCPYGGDDFEILVAPRHAASPILGE